MRKTLLARSSPTRVTDEVSMIDLPTDGSLPDGAFNDDHLGTLDAVRGAVHPISKGSNLPVRGTVRQRPLLARSGRPVPTLSGRRIQRPGRNSWRKEDTFAEILHNRSIVSHPRQAPPILRPSGNRPSR